MFFIQNCFSRMYDRKCMSSGTPKILVLGLFDSPLPKYFVIYRLRQPRQVHARWRLRFMPSVEGVVVAYKNAF